jgi:hypothetical protein
MFQIGADPEFELFDVYNDIVSAEDYCGSYLGGVGSDGTQAELRYNKGYISVDEMLKDTEYYISVFRNDYMEQEVDCYYCQEEDEYDENGDMISDKCEYCPGGEIIENSELTPMAGSGRECGLGGHLHGVFSKPLFMASSDIVNNIDTLLSLVHVPILLLEAEQDRAIERKYEGYGFPFDCHLHKFHIEWRSPFSWLHSDKLAKNILGLWFWWCELIDNIGRQRIKLDNVVNKIETTKFDKISRSIDMEDGYELLELDCPVLDRYNDGYSEFINTAKFIFVNNIDIYEKLGTPLFKKWKPYINTLCTMIQDDELPYEDTNLYDIWVLPRKKLQTIITEKSQRVSRMDGICVSCKNRRDVSTIKIRRGNSIQCLSCYDALNT